MRTRLHPLVVLVSLVAFVALIPTGYIVTGMLGAPSGLRWRVAMGVAAVVVVVANIVFPLVWRFVRASTNATNWFSQKHADRRVSISHVESMIAAGRYDAAAREIDALLVTHGLDQGVCLLAVELHTGKFGSASRAEVLLRRMRVEVPARWEGFATQRLIDLYMSRVDSHAKAMTELRRMIARFPGTPEASGAQTCLDRLRQERAVAPG